MAKDIILMPAERGTCPWCKKPVRIQYQVAVYDGYDSVQILGLEKGREVKDGVQDPQAT